MNEKLYTVKEVSEYFQVTVRSVQRWIQEGKLESYKVGSLTRISEAQLQNFLTKKHKH